MSVTELKHCIVFTVYESKELIQIKDTTVIQSREVSDFLCLLLFE